MCCYFVLKTLLLSAFRAQQGKHYAGMHSVCGHNIGHAWCGQALSYGTQHGMHSVVVHKVDLHGVNLHGVGMHNVWACMAWMCARVQ